MGLIVPIVCRAENSGEHQAADPTRHLLDLTTTPVVTATPTVTARATIVPTRVPPSPQATSDLQMTFGELGYGERILESPWASTQYSFRLPDNWLVEDEGYLDLEFSYFFTDLGRKGTDKLELAFFGEITVFLDGQLLETHSLDEPALDRVHLRVDLPPEPLNEQPGASHQLGVSLDASLLCNVLHEAKLVIHPESTLYLDYTLIPPILDLGDYPRPFYQRSFDADQVRFVLPSQPSEAEMHTAAIVAAGLGDLTGNGVVISATTDVDWLEMAGRYQAGSEHLFVIGQPDRNQLVTWLSDNASLPVSVRTRQMALNSRGQTAVMPGDVFSYTLTVTNTTSATASPLSFTDRIPYQATLVDCQPACTEVSENEVSWSLESLSPDEAAIFSLTLQLPDAAQFSSEGTLLENVAILADEAGMPLNITSLTTAVEPDRPEDNSVVSSPHNDYFFTQNGQPVPDGDGILQEIISPWDPQQVILVVTGVGEEALYKAGQALSLSSPIPDMEGPVALIRETRPLPATAATPATDRTLADLGYSDQTVYGVYPHEITYYFPVPWSWQLGDDSYLRLLFSHSEIVSQYGSTLTVLLGNTPLATVALDQENASQGSVQVKLPSSRIQPGSGNRFSVRVEMQLDRDECKAIDQGQAWLRISNDSVLHLDHRVQDVSTLDLDYYPFPFNTRSDLGDVLLVLPPDPGLLEQEVLLRLAAELGDTVNMTFFDSSVSLGGALDTETLSRYHIIAIGRPSRNPLIQQVNSLLPQPFIPGSDAVEQQVGEVILRLPPDTPLGYVQLLPSPWNESKALLVVTGTTDEGVSWATEALVRLSWRLDGNLALIRRGPENIQIRSVDTRRLTSSGLASAVTTAVPELTSVATVTPTPPAGTEQVATSTLPSLTATTATGQGSLPTWLMFFVGAVVIVVLFIFGIAAWRFRHRQGE